MANPNRQGVVRQVTDPDMETVTVEVEPDNVNRRILDYIASHQHVRGYPPTVRELCQAVKHNGKGGKGRLTFSTSTMSARLQWLEAHGLVTWTPGFPRTIQLVKSDTPQREDGDREAG